MTFKELALLAEDTDEDILAGMDRYEQERKPFYNVSVQLHKTQEHPNGIYRYWFFELLDEKDLKVNTLFHKDRKNFSSSDGNNYYGFKKHYWDMVTQDKELAQNAIRKFLKYAKDHNLTVERLETAGRNNIYLQLESTDEDILAGMSKYEQDNRPLYIVNIMNYWKPDNMHAYKYALYAVPISKKRDYTIYQQERHDYTSDDGKDYYDFKLPVWHFTTENKQMADNVVAKFLNDCKKINGCHVERHKFTDVQNL